MNAVYSEGTNEQTTETLTPHQVRRHERFVEENRKAHEMHFGQRSEFGKRRFTNRSQVKPRRSFGFLNARS